MGEKQPGHEADQSLPSSAEIEECMELYFHFPSMPSWHGAWLKHRGTFTFIIHNCKILTFEVVEPLLKWSGYMGRELGWHS
jgi:hypothetical protein